MVNPNVIRRTKRDGRIKSRGNVSLDIKLGLLEGSFQKKCITGITNFLGGLGPALWPNSYSTVARRRARSYVASGLTKFPTPQCRVTHGNNSERLHRISRYMSSTTRSVLKVDLFV
jgi:hypothetical protein